MSIFDLKTSSSELSSTNSGCSRLLFDQHAPTRDVTQNNFPNGAIHFRWSNSGTKRWIPSRSYLRFRCSLTKQDGTQLTESDNIAPNMGLASTLFQSMEFRINDKTVSRVSDYVPQIDALETRLTKSRSWINSVGNTTNFQSKDFTVRRADVTSDGRGEVVEEVRTRGDLGSLSTTTITLSTGGVFTQSGGSGLNLQTVLVKGDVVEITTTGSPIRYEVSSVPTADTIQFVTTAVVAITGAVAHPWSRIRKTYPSARKVNDFEITWTPPLSIFKIDKALPVGRYELVLNPQTSSSYQLNAVESILANKVPNTATVGAPSAGSNYAFRIVDMYLYTNVLDGPRVDNLTYILDLEQTRCQSESIDSTSFQQKNFDVSPSTSALTVAYQDLRAGNNTMVSSSKFKSYDVAIANSEEQKLNRFFINYAGQNIPAPDADPNFTATQDYTVQRYVESQIHSGAYYDAGGAETIEEYHDKGSYYHFNWSRDGSDRSTRVNVNQQFNAANVTNMRLLCFDHSKQVAQIKIVDGSVTEVLLEDI